jgi:Winged helix DNA-binding domain
MDPETVARRRLTAQQLVGSACRSPVDVVRSLLAVQAQERALDDGELVRTWPMRGTLHAVAVADVRWLVGLLAPRAVAKAAGRFRQLGLEEDQLRRARDVVVAELSGGRAATRAELYAAFDRAGLAPEGQRGIHLLGRLAHELLVCLGPQRGRQPTFVLLDDWVPVRRDERPADPPAELARRYVTGHGPATAHDLAWWSGLPVTQARDALRRAVGLVEHPLDGGPVWCVAGAPPAAPPGGALLLAGFDEYLLGFRDRSAALAAEDAPSVHPGANGVFRPVVILDGRVAGTWGRSGRDRTGIRATLWRPVSTGERAALEAAAARYGAFLGHPVQLSVAAGDRPDA